MARWGTLLALACLLSLAGGAVQAQQNSFVGTWTGSIQGYTDRVTTQRELSVVDVGGTVGCQWNYPDKGRLDTPCSLGADGQLTITTSAGSTVQLRQAGQKLAGTFTLKGASKAYALEMTRKSTPTIATADGRRIPFDELPIVRKFRTLKLPAQSGGWLPTIVIMSTPAFCPSAWAQSTSGDSIDKWQADCTRLSQALLVDYGAATRERCKCVRVIQGDSLTTLKVVSDLAYDPYFYYPMTLVVSAQKSRQRLRGFYAASWTGEFLFVNEKNQVVCRGRRLLESTGGRVAQSQFTCFDGSVTASGTYEIVTTKTTPAKTYRLGRFQLSDGSRLDIIAGLVDADIAAILPNFPD